MDYLPSHQSLDRKFLTTMKGFRTLLSHTHFSLVLFLIEADRSETYTVAEKVEKAPKQQPEQDVYATRNIGQ